MKAKERRQQILTDLRLSQSPITANQFADKYQVSRQVIVGDIALLRAGYADILATNQGYVLAELAGPKIRPLTKVRLSVNMVLNKRKRSYVLLFKMAAKLKMSRWIIRSMVS